MFAYNHRFSCHRTVFYWTCSMYLLFWKIWGPNQSLIGQDAGRIQFCPASSLLDACSTLQENGWSRLWEQSPNCTEESSDWQVLNAVAKAHENVLINLISHHLNVYFLILLWRTVPRAGITAGKMHTATQIAVWNCDSGRRWLTFRRHGLGMYEGVNGSSFVRKVVGHLRSEDVVCLLIMISHVSVACQQ